jgi:hypothetical protein
VSGQREGAGVLESEAPLPVAERAPTAPLRLGVIGLGTVAQAAHLPILAKRRDVFQVAAVCDLSTSLCEAVGERLGLGRDQRFSRAEDVLAVGDLGRSSLARTSPGIGGSPSSPPRRASR